MKNIKGGKRAREISHARALTAWVLSEQKGQNYSDIARLLDMTHQPVLRAVNNINKILDSEIDGLKKGELMLRELVEGWKKRQG